MTAMSEFQGGSLTLLSLDGDEYVGIDTGGSVGCRTTTAAIAELAYNPPVLLAALTLIISELPTVLPDTSGVLWLNSGVVQLS
jgi:hypothetical protein